MKDLELFKNPMLSSGKDGSPVITSLRIAEEFGKQHKDVLKSIRNYIRDIDDPDFVAAQICASYYQGVQGNSNGGVSEYQLSEEAALAITGRFTGKNAAKIQLGIAKQFIAMRDYIRDLESKRVSQALIEVRNQTLAEVSRGQHGSYQELMANGIAVGKQITTTRWKYELTSQGKALGYTQNKNGTVIWPKAGV